MKNKLFALTVIGTLSTGVFAHQIKNELGHNPSWNWNNKNHTHDGVSMDYSSKSNNVIKGMKGLDAIAKVGECYVPAYVEASCRDEMKKVLVKAAYDETEIIPAVTKEIDKRVMVEPAKTIEEYVPALYENIGKKVLVSPARSEWKKGNFTSVQKVVDGDTYCLISVPAVYKTEINKVLKVPATTKIREVAAVYKTYKETVISVPSKTRILKSHPAVYKYIEECVEKSAGRYDWRSVLCEQNANKSVLRSFESKLSAAGYLRYSQVDGIIDDKTTRAIRAYQKSKGLEVDGLVNVDTVKSLGVRY